MSNDDTPPPITVEIRFCVPDDQEQFLPRRRRHPSTLPGHAPLPRVGEVVYLSSSSAWGVTMVIHEWRSPSRLRVELWLEFVSGGRMRRPTGSEVTQ
jgi:hypothetical protein